MSGRRCDAAGSLRHQSNGTRTSWHSRSLASLGFLLVVRQPISARGPQHMFELSRTRRSITFLSDELLSLDYASRQLDPDGAWHALVRLVAQVDQTSPH